MVMKMSDKELNAYQNMLNVCLWDINNSQTLEQLYYSFNKASTMLSKIVWIQLQRVILQDLIEDSDS